jgi:hypothetical protein
MANLAKWAAGSFQSGAWGTSLQSGFTSSDITAFNALGSGATVVASNAIANSTNLDLLGEVSFSFVINASNGTFPGSYVSVYLLPLNSDGTTYGDNVVSGGATSAAIGSSYWVANISVRGNIAAGGTAVGISRPFSLPRGDFKLALFNGTGNALNATAAAVVQFRSTNENLNA